MLRKIWNTLRHGDGRTKSFLLWEIGLILATVIFVCVAIGTHSFLPWVFAAATAILAAAMAKDAVLVDTSDLDIDGVVAAIKAIAREKIPV